VIVLDNSIKIPAENIICLSKSLNLIFNNGLNINIKNKPINNFNAMSMYNIYCGAVSYRSIADIIYSAKEAYVRIWYMYM
jgi:hypothetical protein